MKLALIQQAAGPDRQANVQKGIELAKQAAAAGANIICFAELAFDQFYPQKQADKESLNAAVTIPGPETEAFSKIAKEHQCVIVLNLFERSGEQTFDSSPVIDTDGQILGVTRMIHITDYANFHEQGYYSPGDNGVPVYQTAFGKIGVAICYDRHFPEYMRALSVAGADLVFVPQAGAVDEWPEGLYEAEMRVAAFQNGYFIALCNRVGEEEHLTFAGESFVCNAQGEVIERAAKEANDILYCDVELDELSESYARKLFLRHRRPELYSDWI